MGVVSPETWYRLFWVAVITIWSIVFLITVRWYWIQPLIESNNKVIEVLKKITC